MKLILLLGVVVAIGLVVFDRLSLDQTKRIRKFFEEVLEEGEKHSAE